MTNQVDQDKFDLQTLIQKMDDFLIGANFERYGKIANKLPVNLVSQIITTKKVALRPDDEKRKIAHIAFSYLIEVEFNSVASGLANRVLFTPEYDEQKSWKSPAFRLREGAIRQYQIISSRIAMEIFIDLLHCIETGQRLEVKRSKLNKFKQWLCDPKNEFHYFAHVLLEAYRFDRGFRTPEVHGTSSLPRRLLNLQVPSREEMNAPHQLANVLMNCWRPLLDLLESRRPHYMHVSENERQWFTTYMTGTEEEVNEKLYAMFEGVE